MGFNSGFKGLIWADRVNYAVQKVWNVHLIMRVLKKGNRNRKRLAYTSLVRPILEYGGCVLGPYREG